MLKLRPISDKSSCCCSFLLHVVANLNCIFSVSRRLVLLSDVYFINLIFIIPRWRSDTGFFLKEAISHSQPLLILVFILEISGFVFHEAVVRLYVCTRTEWTLLNLRGSLSLKLSTVHSVLVKMKRLKMAS
jgi:hypothetical protein